MSFHHEFNSGIFDFFYRFLHLLAFAGKFVLAFVSVGGGVYLREPCAFMEGFWTLGTRGETPRGGSPMG